MSEEQNKSLSKAQLLRERFSKQTVQVQNTVATEAVVEPEVVEPSAEVKLPAAEVIAQPELVVEQQTSQTVVTQKKRGRPTKLDVLLTTHNELRENSEKNKTFTIPVSKEAYSTLLDLAIKKTSETGVIWSPQKLVKETLSKALGIKI